jgi:mannosyltransferase
MPLATETTVGTGSRPRSTSRLPHELDERWRDRLAVGLPAAVAAILSFIAITGRSLGFDEAATVTIASQHGSALGSAIAHDGGNMSGYYLLLHLLIGAFGSGLLAIRFVSVLATVATVALIGVIGLRLFGRSVAFVAGVLGAVSLPLVFWAQNARGYAPMVAFVCAAFLAFVALARPGGVGLSRRGRLAWVLYVVFMTLAMYSSFVAVLVVPAQLAVLVRRRRLAARFVIALAAVALLCVPLVLLATSRGSSQLFWLPRPTRKVETQVLQLLTSSGLQPNFHRTPITTLLLIVTVAALLAIAAAVWRRVRRGEGEQWAAIMLLSWVAVPVVLAWLASYVTQPIFLPRNVLTSVPAVALLLAVGLSDRRLPRMAAVTAFVVLVGLRSWAVAASYGVSPEPWQQTTAYVLHHAQPGDCMAFYPEDARMAFAYYVGARGAAAPRSILPMARWGVVRPYVERYETLSRARIAASAGTGGGTGAPGSGCVRMWFVSSHEGQPNAPAASLANRARFLKLRADLERQYGRAPIHQFGYASAIHVQLLPGRGGD